MHSNGNLDFVLSKSIILINLFFESRISKILIYIFLHGLKSRNSSVSYYYTIFLKQTSQTCLFTSVSPGLMIF